MSTTTIHRLLIKTTAAGWYVNADDRDGSRVRKQDDDIVLSYEQWEEFDKPTAEAYARMVAEGQVKSNSVADEQRETPTQRVQRAARDNRPAQPVVVADTGKLLKSRTTTIQCQWVDEEGRNAQVNKLLRTDPRKVTIERLNEAAEEGFHACGESRQINVQDAFQVRFCVAHVAAHRKMSRRKKMAAKRRAQKSPA